MNQHFIQAPAEPHRGMLSERRGTDAPPVSRVCNAAYALEKAGMAMLWASTPISKRVAQENYDRAMEDMRALLEVK